ncbi:helix-turn-helix domain-containing protein [Psychromonas algarum]|uniref:helix-turn-helix domain-containing protein n=1 Tax=Psychromonas algarum TaxID=2555643 RepID=UPI00141A14EC|nr:winged helix-turn-helix domain-containing protein [Psychromonas sp. RZ22]
MDDLNSTDFKLLSRAQTSPQMKMRLLALSHFQKGKSRTEISKFLKVSRTSVNKWVNILLNEGVERLKEKPRTGHAAFISVSQQEQLSQFINDKIYSDKGGRLIGADIHAYIEAEFNKTYHTDSIYYLLKKMVFSWITSRSKHPKQTSTK